MNLKDFYPQTEPYDSGMLKVSDLHTLYYEQVGNPNGKAILFLHGGPGGGIDPDHRRYFDPNHYRIILFDQRGCGKSTPFAELKENTTWDLVSDIERIRNHLNIPTWHVFGGSWGSTLALTYAISHPSMVTGLILRGIFLCRPSEIKWFYQEGASQIFPDYWEKYYNHIPAPERDDFVKAYHKRLTSSDEKVQLEAARIWSQWEMATSYLFVKAAAVEKMQDPASALPFARIECHYFINNAFFPTDNWILEQVHKIRSIPCKIVQGRYDVVCPARSAWDLKSALPDAQLTLVPDAGHSASEVGIRSALIEATEKFRSL